MSPRRGEKGRSLLMACRTAAALCALALWCSAAAAFARSSDEEMLIIAVPGSADLGSGLKPSAKDITVLSPVTIKKGDSLWRISKRTYGRGAYYAQILPFNEIDDPDKIKPGRSLLIPSGSLAQHPDLASRLAGKTASVVFPVPGPAPQAGPAGAPLPKASEPAPKPKPARGKTTKSDKDDMDARMIAALAEQGKCDAAVTAADRFLAAHPNSEHRAAVLWQQAECYRELAGQ